MPTRFYPIPCKCTEVANIVKKDPGRARQSSLVTAGTNFTKPGAQNKGDLCTARVNSRHLKEQPKP